MGINESNEGIYMNYALIGDIHSSKEDLEKVYAQIKEVAPTAEVIGTGDLFECIISKKDITDQKFTALEEVMLNPDGFEALLTFPTVSGNQEERIIQITATDEALREKIVALPETLSIEGAQVIHGHQWKWGGEPWSLQKAETQHRLVFFGHSHTSQLLINQQLQEINWGVSQDVSQGDILVNVGSVVENREWILYNAKQQTVTFMKA